MFVLIAVEHVTGWPIASAAEESTVSSVVLIIHQEIIISFVPTKIIFSDCATAFMAASMQDLPRSGGVDSEAALVYAPMANGRAERVVRTIKHAIRESIVESRKWRILCGGASRSSLRL